jgi:enoyl-CoA hydratase
MEFRTLLFREDESGIGKITINRPQQLNALNSEVFSELNKMIKHIDEDKNIKVAIITGSGDKAFAAGTDIKEMKDMSPLEARDFAILGGKAIDGIENSIKPVIAAVNGFALGGGCELSMACDLRIASDQAKLGQPEVNYSIIPGGGATQRLPRIVGLGRAKELIFTGDIINAQDAFQMGLVNRVVPSDRLMDEARTIAEKILSKGPLAVRFAKEAVNLAMELPLTEGLRREIQLFSKTCGTEDKNEGARAFLEKRSPHFKGK